MRGIDNCHPLLISFQKPLFKGLMLFPNGFIRFANKHRLPVRLGVERYRRQGRAVLVIELSDRVNEPHCRFTSVYNRDPPEIPMHRSLLHSWMRA